MYHIRSRSRLPHFIPTRSHVYMANAYISNRAEERLRSSARSTCSLTNTWRRKTTPRYVTFCSNGLQRVRCSHCRGLTVPESIQLNAIDAQTPDGISDFHYLPDTAKLAEMLKPCLQESEDLPRDPMDLFDHRLFGLTPHLIVPAIKAYADLKLKHEPLTLIQPNVRLMIQSGADWTSLRHHFLPSILPFFRL